MSDAPRHVNALIREKSPYLRQHAHNPVDWRPWGGDALEAARRDDRPIFLSVGYAACHWCHVMERESFEDAAAAALLNEHFVPIKVDREERPDIDEVYMTAVQLMTGRGGWPMSVFLTPDGRPFYGGTYYPNAGFKSLLSQLADAWRNRRDEVEQVARSMADDLATATRQRPVPGGEGAPDPQALVDRAVADLETRFDPAHGGFGDAPKFPPHHALRLLCLALERGDTRALPLLTGTLDKMALGGIYDQVGGGFHRYSTDAIWLLPHFEKMLYDNALLARVYAEAHALTGRESYARIARETCDWVLRDMTDPTGGFHSALDADSEGEEGKYYVWTRAEAEAIAGADFCERYRIDPAGNYRDEATGRHAGASIPHLCVEESCAPLPDSLEPRILAARERLRAAREQRVPPLKDDKILAGWNGLMIGALARVGAILDEPRYLDAARRAARFCAETLTEDGTLLHRWAGGEAAIPAFLDDLGYLADGLIDLAEATGEESWRERAAALVDTLLDDFWDPDEGGFFFTSERRHEALIARSKDLFDGALPSPNGVAARALARLDGDYARSARALLDAFHGLLLRAPQGTATLTEVAAMVFEDRTEAEEGPTLTLIPREGSLTLTPGQSAAAVFVATLPDGWHINARRPERDYLIATIASLASDAPAALGPVAYPVPVERPVGGERLLVYEGRIEFVVPIVVEDDAVPGAHFLEVTLRYQPCTENSCLPPQERTARIALQLIAP